MMSAASMQINTHRYISKLCKKQGGTLFSGLVTASLYAVMLYWSLRSPRLQYDITAYKHRLGYSAL